MKMVLGMHFLTLFDADIWFAERKFIWRSYMTPEALPTTRRVELIDKREFITIALDENSKTFVMHVAALGASSETTKIKIHSSWPTQISLESTQFAALQWNKISTKVSVEYADYIDVFFHNLVMKLPKNTDMNEHAIKLIDEK